ncbi:unnamed protein product [Prorocentrum cordatum]|uniref:Uncharacterized protein n=1 Tax=Prorocentrum cordatum TaxID=2364126 RepID=A0ABN9V7B4_9DINO|nr:unnamed protein product [Polarella glacialis]
MAGAPGAERGGQVWWLFMHVHGGGSRIGLSSGEQARDTRARAGALAGSLGEGGLAGPELDVYSAPHVLETELFLEELRGPGADDFARRVSRHFVDECHGDLELYERTYGRAEGEPSAPPQTGAAAGDPVLASAAAAAAPVAPAEGSRPSSPAAPPARPNEADAPAPPEQEEER